MFQTACDREVFVKFPSFVIVRFVTPVVLNKLIRVDCMFLSNTTYFDS